MKIKGKYKSDDNFTTICSCNTVYTIAKTTGEWASRKVGESSNMGCVLTQEEYNRITNECDKVGIINLKEK